MNNSSEIILKKNSGENPENLGPLGAKQERYPLCHAAPQAKFWAQFRLKNFHLMNIFRAVAFLEIHHRGRKKNRTFILTETKNSIANGSNFHPTRFLRSEKYFETCFCQLLFFIFYFASYFFAAETFFAN